MSVEVLNAAPHAHSRVTVSRAMISVMVCLAPATGFGLFQFGWPAVNLFVLTLVSALGFEILCLLIAGRQIAKFATDGSAILTGWLVAMTLPPWAPWYVAVLGAGIAIVIGKHAFGGLGQNLFNPAMVARAMLLIALPVQMTLWVMPDPIVSANAPGFLDALAITFGQQTDFDAISSASTLGMVQSGLDAGRTLSEIMSQGYSLHDRFVGFVPGSMGETSTVLLLAGGLALVGLRIISLTIPLTVLGSVVLLSAVAHTLAPQQYVPPEMQLSSGALMMCAFFIATDYVTSPMTTLGQAIYGCGIGALIFVIRTWGAFPEGVAFSVLLMNACTPLIDTYTRPRIFGRDRAGKPLEIGKGRS